MTLQEQIRKLAEDAALECFPATNATDLEMSKEAIEAAIREGVKLALAKPSEEMLDAGSHAGDFHIMHYDGTEKPGTPRYSLRKSLSAMSAVRLRELGVEE